MHPLTKLWATSGRPPPNWQGKSRSPVMPPPARPGICALTGETDAVWPLTKITTTLTTLDRLPFRDCDPAGLALGPAATWAVRHRSAMQQSHVCTDDGLREATPADLFAALAGMRPSWWVLVPQSRQKHLLPWAEPGAVRVDDETLPWTDGDSEILDTYRALRGLGFGERALESPAPPWVVMRSLGPADRRAAVREWPLLDGWRAHPAYLDVAARATRKPKESTDGGTHDYHAASTARR